MADQTHSSLTDKFLSVVAKLSAEKWYKQNQEQLADGFNKIIEEDVVVKELSQQDDELLGKMQDQLKETIEANETLQAEYNKVHGVLLNTAKQLTGEEELRQQVPLTAEKLHGIILESFKKGDKLEEPSKVREYLKKAIKTCCVVGGGPRAFGIHEGKLQAYKEILRSL